MAWREQESGCGGFLFQSAALGCEPFGWAKLQNGGDSACSPRLIPLAGILKFVLASFSEGLAGAIEALGNFSIGANYYEIWGFEGREASNPKINLVVAKRL